MNPINRIDEASDYIKGKIGEDIPDTAIVLGTGLGDYTKGLDCRLQIPFGDIPFFSVPTAPGHEGILYIGQRAGHSVIVLSGRCHYYEGFTMDQVVFSIQVLARMGVRRLIITNSTGLINRNFAPGELMLIRDHFNLTGNNPLIGPNQPSLGERFPDMSDLYNRRIRKEILAECNRQGISLHEGIYAMMTGPSYETPSEIHVLGLMGADVVGMSSVPEAIAAKHTGMEVIGISALSNWAAGINDEPISNEDVIVGSRKTVDQLIRVIDIALMTPMEAE